METSHQRELVLRLRTDIVLGPGVRRRVEGLGAPDLTKLSALDELRHTAGDDDPAVAEDDEGRVPPPVLHGSGFDPVVAGGVEVPGVAQALEFDRAEVVRIAVVAIDAAAGLVVPVGTADTDDVAVGRVRHVGAEHVPGVVLVRGPVRGAARVLADAGGGAATAHGAADEAVTRPSRHSGHAREVCGVAALARVTGMDVGVLPATVVVCRREPRRGSVAQVEHLALGVPALGRGLRADRELDVLAALDAVPVEDPAVLQHPVVHGGRLAQDAAVRSLGAAGRGAAFLEGRGPLAHLVGRAGALGPHHRRRRAAHTGGAGEHEDRRRGGPAPHVPAT